MIPGPIQATVDLLQELKAAGYPLYALSNWAEEKYAIVRPRYDFFALFDGVLLSSQVRLLKPDPRIFRLFLERIGRQAETCVYIDDTLENVVAARGLGFQAIHFQSGKKLYGQLKHFLRKPGS
jgi:2-haloacid dehalogenase